MADDRGIRVVESGVIRELDADFGVAVIGPAGFPAKLAIQKAKAISGNVVMLDGRAGHRVDGPTKVFMLGDADFLAREIVAHSYGFRPPVPGLLVEEPCSAPRVPAMQKRMTR